MQASVRTSRQVVPPESIDDGQPNEREHRDGEPVELGDVVDPGAAAYQEREHDQSDDGGFEEAGGHGAALGRGAAGLLCHAAERGHPSKLPRVTTLGAHSPKLDSVRDLRTKRGRREQGLFAVEGPTMLAEALAAGLAPQAVYATDACLESLADRARFEDVLFRVPERAMARLSDLESPPGILAVLPIALAGLEDLLERGRPVVALAGVADPGNAGTLLRSAEIFGFAGAIFAADAVEPHNPKVVRASMGAIFRLEVAVAEPAGLLEVAGRHGYMVIAASREGEPLPGFRFPARAVIAIGHERRGVAAWLPRHDRSVSIPQSGQGESLNAAIAGSIILYAFSQQV